MGASIAGLLILAVFLTGALMLTRSTLFSNVVTSNAIKEAAQLAGERARTEIGITSSSTTTVFRCSTKLQITVDNTGSVTISDFDKMDIVHGTRPKPAAM